MGTETLICFSVGSVLVVMMLNALCRVVSKFIELSETLGGLIEVSYQATHDPDFDVNFPKKAKQNTD